MASIQLSLMVIRMHIYRIAGKFGGELNLALWRIDQPTAKLKIHQYLIRVYRGSPVSRPPNLNPPIFLFTLVGANPPNLMPAKFSSYTRYTLVNMTVELNPALDLNNLLRLDHLQLHVLLRMLITYNYKTFL